MGLCQTMLNKTKRSNNKANVHWYSQFLQELKSNKKSDLSAECCHDLKIDPQKSTMITAPMMMYHYAIVKIFAAAIEDRHRVQTDQKLSCSERTELWKQWDFYPLVAETVKRGDVHQGIILIQVLRATNLRSYLH